MTADQDVIIVGSGMSALIAAITLATEKNVKIFTKEPLVGGNSWRAQGGMAVAIDKEDRPQDHLQDTLEAGCYHNNVDMVSILVKEGLPRVKKWMKQGMAFDQEHGILSLGMEGAHRKRRILHAGGDQTGLRWMEFLHQQLKNHPNIQKYENEMVFDLVMENGECRGVVSKNTSGNVSVWRSSHTILATGGCGGIFEATTNDPSIVGDGIAMAYRAGAKVSDLEFMQFHPTLIKYNKKVVGLASEALRGEGAILVDQTGRKIMEGIHPLQDLAPRDVVARVIERETLSGNQVYLDITSIRQFEKRFPTITAMCKQAGIPLEKGRIPITTGAHFLMGGVVTDQFGRTTVPGLFAVGEVARTGVHGANRLASNSLLEALVFGERVGEYILEASGKPLSYVMHSNSFLTKAGGSYNLVFPKKEEIQKQVSRALGVERNEMNLTRFLHWLDAQQVKEHLLANRSNWSMEEVEIANMLLVTWLMAKSALERMESRGAHYRTDYPKTERNWDEKQVYHRNAIIQSEGRGTYCEQIIT
ncbi:L-aspartate oxidase [Evansella sp. AB-rgal1]|uniref:L-aspartate oxidase n=1 Tax=Evansella sp. AB-rgal1 TaxID=3242696 RepID=UPI00359E5675